MSLVEFPGANGNDLLVGLDPGDAANCGKNVANTAEGRRVGGGRGLPDLCRQAEDLCGVGIEAVVAKLVADPEKYEDGGGQADGETANIQHGKELVAADVAEGDLEVITKHGTNITKNLVILTKKNSGIFRINGEN